MDRPQMLLMLAFSEPETGREAEFERWYDMHCREVLATPGFVAVRRYLFAPMPDMSRSRYRYLAIYEIETDAATARDALDARVPGFTPFDGMALKPRTYFFDPLTGRSER